MIRPTHTCFDDALDFFQETMTREEIAKHHTEYTIVHAECVAPGDEQLFAHAWVEHDGIVWQGGLLDAQRIYYGIACSELPFEVRREHRYTFAKALKQNWDTGYYGPWVPELLELCRAGTRAGVVVPVPRVRLLVRPYASATNR